MRRIFASIALASFVAFPAPLLAGVPGLMHFERSQADQALLDQISRNWNAVRTLKGGFVQLGPDGQVDTGEFYLDKPGRMRFAYTPPNPVLIVSDGSTVAVANRTLDTIDHYPVWSTPLDLILSTDLDLKRNPSIAGISREPGQITVTARAHSDKINGNISIVFADPGLELRQWTVVDAQGLSTTISLRNVQTGMALDPALFELPKADTKAPR